MNTAKKVMAALAATTMMATAALVTAPAASAADARTQVNLWYFDWLDRHAPDDPSSQHWVDQINGGAKASDQVWAIMHSAEFNNSTIDAYYEGYLGRSSAGGGSTYWRQGVKSGAFPLEWVRQNVLASPEYQGKHRGTLIRAWYGDVLVAEDRTPSRGEVAYWEGRVRQVGALDALRELWYSPEAVNDRITINYFFLLNREPSAGERAYWYPKTVESDINVSVLISSTEEYSRQIRDLS